jgi:hypothetical protein
MNVRSVEGAFDQLISCAQILWLKERSSLEIEGLSSMHACLNVQAALTALYDRDHTKGL